MATLSFGYTELIGSGKESLETFTLNVTATRIFYGPWVDRWNFIKQELLFDFTDDGTNTITIKNLASYPDLPQAVVSRINIEGVLKPGTDGNLSQISYEKAKITVFYEVLDISVNQPGGGGNVIVTEAVTSSVEILEFPGEDSTDEDGKKIPELGILRVPLPLETRTVNVFFVLNPNWSSFLNALGKINSQPVLLPVSGISVPAKQARFDGYSANKGINLNEISFWNLSLTLTINPNGWDTLPTKNGNKVIFRPNGDPLYESAIFPTFI